MKVEEFHFQDVQLVRSCGEFACDGGHDPELPCLGFESVHSGTVYALRGSFIIDKPETNKPVLVEFRSRKMAQFFIHKSILDEEPNILIDKINTFELFHAANGMLIEYKKANIFWNLVAWFKSAFSRTN
jgi:hypothetical protein